jgi:hypothetical protein
VRGVLLESAPCSQIDTFWAGRLASRETSDRFGEIRDRLLPA